MHDGVFRIAGLTAAEERFALRLKILDPLEWEILPLAAGVWNKASADAGNVESFRIVCCVASQYDFEFPAPAGKTSIRVGAVSQCGDRSALMVTNAL